MKLSYSDKLIEIDDADWEKVKKHSWFVAKDGRVFAKIRGQTILLHRFLLDAKANEVVLFVDECRKDCFKRANLLKQSKVVKKGCYVGVYFSKGKWIARISGNHIGSFTTEEDAARAYDEEHFSRHGYRVNFANPSNAKIDPK
jgi:hypothetical protein